MRIRGIPSDNSRSPGEKDRRAVPAALKRLAVSAIVVALFLNFPLAQADVLDEVPVETSGSGVVPGVIGHVGNVTLDDEAGFLRVALEMEGQLDAFVPGPMGNPFVYEVAFTSDHNGLEQEYALQYTYETDPFHEQLIADKFALVIKTESESGLQSVCTVDADLSQSHFDLDAFEPVWIVALSEFDHDNRTPPGDCSMAQKRDGRGLEAGDVLRGIEGSATAKAATVQFSDLKDTTEVPDYTVESGGQSAVDVVSVSPGTGSTAGGIAVSILGSGFHENATVWFNETAATGVLVVNASEIEAVTPAHEAGTVDVHVRNPDNGSGTLLQGFTYEQEGSVEDGPSIRIDSPSENETVAPDFGAAGIFSSGNESDTNTSGTSQRASMPEGDLEHLRVPVPDGATWNLAQGYESLLPGLLWNDAIGPGTPIAIAFTPGATFPEFICTANWVYNDHTGAVYLGAAGHCFLPEGTRTTHGDSGDVPVYDPQDVTVWACAGDCLAGGFTGDIASIFLGNYIEVGAVEYARQKPADGSLDVDADGVGHDFGIVRIPDELLHLVDTRMPVWGGPDESYSGDSWLMPMALHGSGSVYGETFATKSRLGESLGSLDGRSWQALIPSFGGDSGSSVSVYTGFVPAGTPAAHGLLTHGIIGVPFASGTLIDQAIAMALEDADLCLQPIMAGQHPGEAEPAPGCEDQDGGDGGDDDPVQAFVQVRLDNTSWVDVQEQTNTTWSHNFTAVEPGEYELHARLADDQGLTLALHTVTFTVADCPGPEGQGPSSQGCEAGGAGTRNCPETNQGPPDCDEQQAGRT